jgi:hypothetical protein
LDALSVQKLVAVLLADYRIKYITHNNEDADFVSKWFNIYGMRMEQLLRRIQRLEAQVARLPTDSSAEVVLQATRQYVEQELHKVAASVYAAFPPRDAHVARIEERVQSLEGQGQGIQDLSQLASKQALCDLRAEQEVVGVEQRANLEGLRLEMAENMEGISQVLRRVCDKLGPEGFQHMVVAALHSMGFSLDNLLTVEQAEQREIVSRAEVLAEVRKMMANQGTQPPHFNNNRREEEEPLGLESSTLTITGAGGLDISSGHSTHHIDERSQEAPPTASDLLSDPNTQALPGQAAEQQPDTPRRRRQRGLGPRRAQAQNTKGKCGGVGWQVLLCALVMVVAAVAGAFGPRPSYMAPTLTPTNASSWAFASSGRINTTKVSSSSLRGFLEMTTHGHDC